MSDVTRLVRDYLRQLTEMGEELVVLPPAATEGDNAAPRPASPGATEGEQGRANVTTGSRAGDGPKWKRGAPAIPERGIIVPAPSKDLFSEDPLAGKSLEQLAAMIRSCTECRLCESRTQAVPGEGPPDARLVVVGEGPGAREDETGRPFVGRAGELLTDILAAIGLPRESVFICNVVKCRPPSNRKPQQDEIDTCVPYLYRQLDLIGPGVILAMGGTAAETLLGVKQPIGALRNRVHEFRGIPLVVTYHPAALLRNPHWKKPTWDDVRIARRLLDERH